MGFLDMGGSLGRRFGSIGVAVNEISTRLTIRHADTLSATGPDAERAEAIARTLATEMGQMLPARIEIERAIPGHAGLGSGTQLALAVGTALARLHGLPLSPPEIPDIIGRGARSGIGIATFASGGLIVDAGRGPQTRVPPVIARLDLPESWRFLIVLDAQHQGLHGAPEKAAFAALPAFPGTEAARLCHLLLMQGLPAVVEEDLDAFGAVITELQAVVGDHFAPAQGGRFTSPAVAAALAFLANRGAVGIGQSSWGPTGFCLVATPDQATRLRDEASRHFGDDAGLRFVVGSPRHQGADITVEPLAAA